MHTIFKWSIQQNVAREFCRSGHFLTRMGFACAGDDRMLKGSLPANNSIRNTARFVGGGGICIRGALGYCSSMHISCHKHSLFIPVVLGAPPPLPPLVAPPHPPPCFSLVISYSENSAAVTWLQHHPPDLNVVRNKLHVLMLVLSRKKNGRSFKK